MTQREKDVEEALGLALRMTKGSLMHTLGEEMTRLRAAAMPLTTVYLVERVGVHPAGVLGVFLTEAEARQCAESATEPVPRHRPNPTYHNGGYSDDNDGYHDFLVSRVTVGLRAVECIVPVAKLTSMGEGRSARLFEWVAP